MWDSWTGEREAGVKRRGAEAVRLDPGETGRGVAQPEARAVAWEAGFTAPAQRAEAALGRVGGRGPAGRCGSGLRGLQIASAALQGLLGITEGPARRGVLARRGQAWGERSNLLRKLQRDVPRGSAVRDDSGKERLRCLAPKAHDLGEKARQLLSRDLREQQIERLLDRLLTRQVGDEVVHRAADHRLGISEQHLFGYRCLQVGQEAQDARLAGVVDSRINEDGIEPLAELRQPLISDAAQQVAGPIDQARVVAAQGAQQGGEGGDADGSHLAPQALSSPSPRSHATLGFFQRLNDLA